MKGRVLDFLRALYVDTRVVTDYVRCVPCYGSKQKRTTSVYDCAFGEF
jgi:hypothetical protein